MGKPKFTVEEGKRIMQFIRKWRKKNPDAIEWPLDDLQQSLQLNNYSKLQIKNKIKSLQKSEKHKGSPCYDDMCIRQSTPSTKRGYNSGPLDTSTPVKPSNVLMKKLDIVKQMILIADPTKVFDGWFQLQVHAKANLGTCIGETWNKIVEHWDKISVDLPSELLDRLKDASVGTKYSQLLFNIDVDIGAPKNQLNDDEDNSSDDDYQPVTPNCTLSGPDSDVESINSAEKVTLVKENSNLDPDQSDLNQQILNKARIPFKYMVSSDWTFTKSKLELEPTCFKFGLEECESGSSLNSNKWPILVPALINYHEIWSKVTDDETWKNLLCKTKLTADPFQTKMEFFRDILPRREEYFDVQKVKMEMCLNPTQSEALNLIFYTMYKAQSFASFQRLIDEGLLSSNYAWYVWIFVLKAKLNEDGTGDIFGASNAIQSVVNERLDNLIFQDGMSLVYNTPKGKPVIERLIRMVYGTEPDT